VFSAGVIDVACCTVEVVTIIIFILNDNLYSAVCTGSTSRALHNKQNNCQPNAINKRK